MATDVGMRRWRWLRIHDRETTLDKLIRVLNERLKALEDFLGNGGGGARDGANAAETFFWNNGSVLVAADSEYLYIPFDCTITLAELVADVAGNLTVEVWASSYPVWSTFTKISGSAPMTLAGVDHAHPPLTGWTTAFTGGTYFLFRVTGTPALIKKATATLQLTMQNAVMVSPTGQLISGTAGGVLSGSYPNPGFADDMATQAELNAETAARIAGDAAQQAYTDTRLTGLPWKQAVRVKTTANVNLAGGGLAAGTTHDGVTLATGDRVLVGSQTAPAENGFYIAPASGAASRATDADSGAELVNATCYVSEGTQNADTQWTCTTNATITVGSTSLTFAQLSGGSARLVPSIVQSASLRGDGTIALGATPTVGNLMLWAFAGFTGTESSYRPTGFTKISDYNSDANNRVAVWFRRVVTGDTGSYAITATDNQGCALYEFANADWAYPLAGGAMSGFFSGTAFSITVPQSPFEGTCIRLFVVEQDVSGAWTITSATGLTKTYNPASDGNNHQGTACSLTDAVGSLVAGSVGSGPTQPVYGVWAVVGKKV